MSQNAPVNLYKSSICFIIGGRGGTAVLVGGKASARLKDVIKVKVHGGGKHLKSVNMHMSTVAY